MIPAVMPTYGRWDVAVERGEGPYLYATDGRKFLDFTSGIAVTGLGHCHPHVVGAVTEQAKRLWHTSNLFRIPGQERLAQRLVDNTFAETVFFPNLAEALSFAVIVAKDVHRVVLSEPAMKLVEELAPLCLGDYRLKSFSAERTKRFLQMKRDRVMDRETMLPAGRQVR